MNTTNLNDIYINEEVIKILNLYNKNTSRSKKFDIYSFDNCYSKNYQKKILLVLIKKISYGNLDFDKNYKIEYFYYLLDFIVDNLNSLINTAENDIIKFDLEINIVKSDLLRNLTNLNKGQYLLIKLTNNIYQNLSDNDIHNYLLIAAKYGTFATFIFWLNKTRYKTIEQLSNNLHEDIFCRCICNSDDRLYKHILDKILLEDKLFFCKNVNLLNTMIICLGGTSMPDKFILKRLRILSEYTELTSNFETMIKSFKSSKVILGIHKYYYIYPHTFINLSDIINNIFLDINFDILITKLYDLMKTNDEKNIINIILILKYNYYKLNNDRKILNLISQNIPKNLKKIIIDNMYQIIKIILNINYYNFINNLNNNIIKIIFRIITDNNLLGKFYNKILFVHNDFNYLLFTRFFYCNDICYANKSENKYCFTFRNIKANLLLHHLRMYAKRFYKIKIIMYHIKMYEIHNDIKFFKPIKNIPVLKNGSLNYQLQNQQFSNNLSKKYLLPNEINNIQKIVLREITNGIKINNLPLNIFPFNNIIYNYNIEAEYIENLDLYLIIDIDIPNTTINERYNILKNIHPHAKKFNNLSSINNIDEFHKIINDDKYQISLFLNKYKDINIKWYPKFNCIFIIDNGSNDLYNYFINNTSFTLLDIT